MFSTTLSASRFRALDGWRGICALLVALHHIEVHGFLYWQPLVRNAWLFVDFFFVLSGFVIAHAYGARLDSGGRVWSFAVRRFGRLWPLHIAVLLALIGLEVAHLVIDHVHPIAGAREAFTADRSPFAILTNVFLVQAMGLHPFETWNGPAWSISCEFFTYLIFAAVCFLAPKWRLALSLLLCVGGALLLARFSRYGMRETFDWAFPRCLYGFFAGVLAYAVWQTDRLKFLRGTSAEVLTLFAVLAFLTFVPGHFALEYLATPLFAVAVLVFAGEQGVLSQLLVSRPAAALGRWSFAIYMVHTLVLAVMFSAIHAGEKLFHRHWLIDLPDGNATIDMGFSHYASGLVLAYLIAVIALAAAAHRFIERPGQAFFARLDGRKPPVLTPQPA